MRDANNGKMDWLSVMATVTPPIIVLILYARTSAFGFFFMDDIAYVTANSRVLSGLSWDNIKWAFGFQYNSYWHPLTYLSLMFDTTFFGTNSHAMHVHNVLLHAVNSALVFITFKRLTRQPWVAGFIATVFAVHPIHVESVVWITERKDMLSMLFFLLTLLAYDSYTRDKKPSRLVIVALPMAGALLSKPTTIVLPFLLLLLDYWPYQRLQLPLRANLRKGALLVVEKLPFMAMSLGVLAIVLASNALTPAAGNGMDGAIPTPLRLGNALVSYVTYLRQSVWPTDLAVFYSFPQTLGAWEIGGATMIIALLTFAAARARKEMPGVLMGWLWFLGSMLPMSGIIQSGLWPAHADRFAYIPFLGLYLGVASLLAFVFKRKELHSGLKLGAIAVPCLALFIISWQQVALWDSPRLLLNQAIEAQRNNYMAHSFLGTHLRSNGRDEEASREFEKALAAMPDRLLTPKALLLLELGRLDEATPLAQKAVSLDPNNSGAMYILGKVAFNQGAPGKALELFEASIRANPSETLAYSGAGVCQLQLGNTEKALQYLLKADELAPGSAITQHNIGVVYAKSGRFEPARKHFEAALAIDPSFARSQAAIEKINKQTAADK